MKNYSLKTSVSDITAHDIVRKAYIYIRAQAIETWKRFKESKPKVSWFVYTLYDFERKEVFVALTESVSKYVLDKSWIMCNGDCIPVFTNVFHCEPEKVTGNFVEIFKSELKDIAPEPPEGFEIEDITNEHIIIAFKVNFNSDGEYRYYEKEFNEWESKYEGRIIKYAQQILSIVDDAVKEKRRFDGDQKNATLSVKFVLDCKNELFTAPKPFNIASPFYGNLADIRNPKKKIISDIMLELYKGAARRDYYIIEEKLNKNERQISFITRS